MAEAFAIGISPAAFWLLTPRELFAAFNGAKLKRIRENQLHLWTAWQTANLTNAKRLPDLLSLLRKLEPARPMTNREMRASIIGIAAAMGAKIVRKKKGEP